MNKLDIAKQHRSTELSVIPLKQNSKIPAIASWKPFTERYATDEELQSWFVDKDFNVGIVCGKISGITVIDIDGEVNIDFPETLSAMTPNGKHLVYQHVAGINNLVRVNSQEFDIRNDNSYIVAYPSIVNGKQYKWLSNFNREFVKPFSKDLIESEVLTKKETDWSKIVDRKNSKGMRNDALVQYGGKILCHFPKEDWDTVGWEAFKSYDLATNEPPLQVEYGIEDIKRKWDGLKKKEEQKMTSDNKQQSQADQIITLINKKVERGEVKLFKNQVNEAYAKCKVNDHFEILSIKDRSFKQLIGKPFFSKNKKVPNSEAINTALNTIEGLAIFDNEQLPLNNRLVWKENELWYDLSNEKFSAVKINSEGWEIVNEPPILFKRYSHQKQQVNPTQNGDVKRRV